MHFSTTHKDAPALGITLVAALVLAISACNSSEPVATPTAAPDTAAPTTPGKAARPAEPVSEPVSRPSYVTTATCSQCHAEQAAAWTGSHHDLAMQPATAETVLGNFDDQSFDHLGTSWQFRTRDGKYFVSTEDAAGEQSEFEILYTFGVSPLQQYLVAQAGGRMHALTAAWDTRDAEAGGQRWFSLHGDEQVPPSDVLHWTGPGQKWNSMCADCHSTGYEKDYDASTRSYTSSWSDIDVGCEACHGPGSDHVAWAREPNDDPTRGLSRDMSSVRSNWSLAGGGRVAGSDGAGVHGRELDTCAPCHSRRSTAGDADADGEFLDHYRPALLDAGLYHPDGQIRDEVYVWGSFLQSRMHGAGVTCSDCHDPHSLALRAEGDALCGSCHNMERYASTVHHHHDVDGEGARCVGCHMPERVYMEIDGRRDHSIRVPRPDLSVRIGTPNACTDCHTDRSADWAAQEVADWPNSRQAGLPHYGDVLASARSGVPGAALQLASIVGNDAFAAIVRATALIELAAMDADRTRSLIEKYVGDARPLLRYAVARSAYALPPNVRLATILPLVRDPLAMIRAEAGRNLAGINYASTSDEDRAAIKAAVGTYIDSEQVRIDEPSAGVNLGLLRIALGELDQAEAAYREAIAAGPYFLPAYINLADLYRQTDRDSEGLQLLDAALERAPENAEVHHAIGLHHIRSKRTDEAIVALERAHELAPENVRFTYVYGVALDSVGRTDDALQTLRNGLNYATDNPTLLQALISVAVKAGRQDEARRYMDRIRAIAPQDR